MKLILRIGFTARVIDTEENAHIIFQNEKLAATRVLINDTTETKL